MSCSLLTPTVTPLVYTLSNTIPIKQKSCRYSLGLVRIGCPQVEIAVGIESRTEG